MKVFVVGATGRMGTEIQSLIEASKDWQWAGGLCQKPSPKEKLYSSFDKVKEKIDVVIDFSSPDILQDTLEWCVAQKKPLLSGTTGITPGLKTSMKKASQKIPLLWTANTSPGIHIVKKLLQEMKIAKDFDVQMIEHHHKHKKDKPSGTAILLQDVLKKDHKNMPEPISVRGGGIFGIHRVEFIADDEIITIEHRALSRKLFARGALDAARWLARQKAGLYSMDDFILS